MTRRADRESSEPMAGTSSSITTGPSYQGPVSTWSERPLLDTPHRHHICDDSKQRRIEKFEMLLQRRPLRVQSARCSRQTEMKLDIASTSQKYFKIDVPKWSDYFPPPSDEKKISTSPVAPKPPNSVAFSDPEVSPFDKSQSSSEVQAVPEQEHAHKVEWSLNPAPVIVSDRSTSDKDTPVGLPVETTELFSVQQKASSSIELRLKSQRKTGHPYMRSINNRDDPVLESLQKIVQKICPDAMTRRADSKASEPCCQTLKTTSSTTTGPSSQDPVSTWSARPLLDTPHRHHICDDSKQRRIEKFEMLLQRRPLRVQSARCSRRTEMKLDIASTSQKYFKIDVPKWSDYFPPPTDEKKISTSPVAPKPPNSVAFSDPEVSPFDKSQSSSEVQAVPEQEHAHKVEWSLNPAPVIVSDRSTSDKDTPVGLPVETTELFSVQQKASSSIELRLKSQRKTGHPYMRSIKNRDDPVLESLQKIVQKICPDGMTRRADSKASEPCCQTLKTTSSTTTGPSSQDPVSTWSERPLLDTPHRHHICDDSKQRRIEKFEMLLQRRPLRVQSARCSRRTEMKLDIASTSQKYFKIDVPKWSDYFPPPSDEKKISTSPVAPKPPNSVAFSDPEVSPFDKSQSSSEVQAVPEQEHAHMVEWSLNPAPVIVSDRSTSDKDTPVGLPVVSTLVIGDSTLKFVQIESPGTVVNCIKGARASDIKNKLTVLANAKRRFDRIIIQIGINEVQLRLSEISKINIKEVCDLAKTMSDTVICSGPIPCFWGGEMYSRLSSLHDWMCKWCPQNNFGFIDNWKYFFNRPDLFGRDGYYPNRKGTAILSKCLTHSLNSASV